MALAAPAGAEGPAVPKPSVVPFDDLGMDEPLTLGGDAGSEERLAVAFKTQEGWTQGDPYWMGIRLHLSWEGAPGPKDLGRLQGFWNDKSMFLVEAVSPPGDLPGLRWSTADIVSGSASAWDLSDSFEVEYTNFARYQSFPSDEHKISFELDLQDWQAEPPSVTIHPDSAVIITRWTPAKLSVDADVTIGPEAVRLSIDLRNTGWEAPSLGIRATVAEEDGQVAREAYRSDDGIEQLGTAHVDMTIPRPPDEGRARRDPESVHIEVSWGTGGTATQVWPVRTSARLDWFRPLASTTIAALALVAAWIAIPIAFGRGGKAR